MIIDADLVVIGGGVGLAPNYLDRVRKAVGSDRDFAIEPAFLGADSGLIGVAKWGAADRA